MKRKVTLLLTGAILASLMFSACNGVVNTVEESEAYTTHTLPTGLTEYIPNTKLVRIVCSVTYDKRSKKSDVTYTIRN